MGRTIRAAAFATVFMQCLGGAAYAAVTMERLCVRIYDAARTAPEQRAHAMKRAGEILRGAEVDVDWRDCSPNLPGIHEVCSVPPEPGEIVVRLVRSPGAPASRTLGEAFVDTSGRRGVLATVFMDRVEALAALARIDLVGLAGRVIAHEIGHLLLGTNTHTKNGLMREVWSVKDLSRNRGEDWVFSQTDIDRLRRTRRVS
jgi:hypothetical protein